MSGVEQSLARSFFARDPLEVAPELLGKILVHGERAGRVVEVEAYRGERDAASHAYHGLTPRCATMFGPPGHLYVYFTYGMHFCANVVCSPPGVAGAVLLRALAPLRGLREMRAARGAREGAPDRLLCSGPARLCQALGLDRSFDGSDLVTGDRGVWILSDCVAFAGAGAGAGAGVTSGRRVGISARAGEASQLPWRYFVAGDPHVSRPATPRPVGEGGA